MEQKHPCPDCRMCQWCSDDRCRQCLRSGCRKKLSMAEQIALYEALNGRGPAPPDDSPPTPESSPGPEGPAFHR